MERIIFNGGKKKGKNGGARKGAGRPLGARNKFSQDAVAAARETGKLPHEIMLEVAQAAVGTEFDWWGVVDKEDKKWALFSCASYFAPKMTASDHSGNVYIMSLPQEMMDRIGQRRAGGVGEGVWQARRPLQWSCARGVIGSARLRSG
jgi:hypothetical protein